MKEEFVNVVKGEIKDIDIDPSFAKEPEANVLPNPRGNRPQEK